MITAPYNFVPLNREVFYPDWADKVSHDVPFEDGESGVVSITIRAESPIYIRNHYQEGDDFYVMEKDGKKMRISKEFCSYFKDGKREFYIPGSSLKGMVRSVLEIMSFARIKIDEERHKKPMSVRDMTNRELVATAQKCGFLTIEQDGRGTLEDCGKVKTIAYDQIKAFSGVNLFNVESAVDKYKKVQSRHIPYVDEKKLMDVRGKKIPKVIAKYDSNSSKKGELVFTNKIDRKKNEFVFRTNGTKVPVSKKIVDAFKNVYFEDVNSTLGQYWKGKKRIPVFYTTDREGNIQAIGLTQIFKMSYRKTVLEAAKQNTKGFPDMPETIFGFVDEKKSLKGRVYFSHLEASIVRYESSNVKEEVLGSPNPSYYPNYIVQSGKNGKVNRYKSLMDNDATIRGYKRYPLQPAIWSNHVPNDNEKVATRFKPLDTGTTFTGKIRFHNLKKTEIGALLSALTFFGQEDRFYHNIGMAKPLGYGKISIRDIHMDPGLKHSREEYLDAFEELMDSWDDKEYVRWKESVQILNLFAMHNKDNDKVLAYQKLENPNPQYFARNGKAEKNDFTGAKKAKEYLQAYVSLKTKKDNTVPKGKEQKKTSHKSTEKADISALEEKFGSIKTQPKKRQEGSGKPKNPFRGTIKKVPKESLPVDTPAKKEQTSVPKTAPAAPPKEYTMKEIAQETGMSVADVVAYANASTLPIPKGLDSGSVLKEAQAKGLINRLKKEKKQ